MLIQNNLTIREHKKYQLEISGALGNTSYIWKKYDLNGVYSYFLSKDKDEVIFRSLCLNHKKTKMKFGSNLNNLGNHSENFNATPLAIFRQKIQGVSRGYFVYLKVVGVGYRVFFYENCLTFKIGFSHFYKMEIPNSIRVFLPEPTLLCFYGIDKNQVTQIAARIKNIKPPSVYKGKGIRLMNDFIRLKEGKKKS